MALASPSRRQARTARRQPIPPPAAPRDPVAIVAAGVGLLVALSLLLVDLAGGTTACLTGSDCDAVRASGYGRLFGIPVAALGVAFFGAVLVATLARTAAPTRWLAPLAGLGLGAALVFLGVQALVLRAWCPYCVVADLAALTIAWRVLRPRAMQQPTGRIGRALAGAALAVAVLVGGYVVTGASPTGPTAAGVSPADEPLAALADHLRESGATFYGAYWCPHCQEQKRLFGTAASRLPYVECDPRGQGADSAACQAAGVTAYPTWAIGGQRVEGTVSVAELARRSGFSR